VSGGIGGGPLIDGVRFGERTRRSRCGSTRTRQGRQGSETLTGGPIEGSPRPDPEARARIVLCREFRGLGGVVHSRSGVARCGPPSCFPFLICGRPHAAALSGDAPCTEVMGKEAAGGGEKTQTETPFLGRVPQRDRVPPHLVRGPGGGPLARGETPPRRTLGSRCSKSPRRPSCGDRVRWRSPAFPRISRPTFRGEARARRLTLVKRNRG